MREFDVVDNIYNYTAKASMEAAETHDAFIFKTIEPFINEVACFSISKKELVDAILLIRLKKEAAEKYGSSLNCDLTKATEVARELGEAYDRGFMDGVKKERKRLLTMLEEDLEDLEE
jgi:hypothetical protein